MKIDPEKLRGEFKKWAIKRGWIVTRNDSGDYTSGTSYIAWIGFKFACQLLGEVEAVIAEETARKQ